MRQFSRLTTIILISLSMFSFFTCTSQSSDKATLVGEQLVNDFVEMWNSKDVNKIDLIFTDDCVYNDIPALTTYHGKDEVKGSLKEDFTWCSNLKLELISRLVTEEGAAIEWMWSGRQTGNIEGLIKATGKSFSIQGTSIMEFKNKKIKKNADYYDAGEFLHQLGVKLIFPTGEIWGDTQTENKWTEVKKKEAAIQAIGQIHKKAAVAVKNGDVAAYVDLFTEDGIYLWPNVPAISGREALNRWFEKRFREYAADLEKSVEEIEVLDDWAFERGNEVSKIRNRSTNEVQVVRGKFINIFKKQSDGHWKIARRIRNLDHPFPSN